MNVSLLPPSKDQDAGQRKGSQVEIDGEDDSGIICETFVENAADVVDVLPATKNRTVLVPIQPRDEWEIAARDVSTPGWSS